MTAPTKKAPAKKAATKRSPRAAKPQPAAAEVEEPQLTDEDLDALASDVDEDEGPIAKDGTVRPVQIGKSGRKPVELAPVFELDGHTWQVPAKPSPALMIQFQMDMVEMGREEAVARLLITYLGKPALQALAASPDVSEEDTAKVFDILHHYAFGETATRQHQAASDPS